jgi:hypothetical protein
MSALNVVLTYAGLLLILAAFGFTSIYIIVSWAWGR